MVATLEQQVGRWLRKTGIPVSASLLRERLSAHPDYPSLLSVTDVLDEWGIDNAALVIDKERLQQVPLPFLAHDVRNNGFVLINNIEKQVTNNLAFNNHWNGTALLAEKPDNWHYPENDKRLAEEKKNRQLLFLSIFTVCLLAASSLINGFSWQLGGLLLSTFAGLGIAVLIIQHELGISNELTEQFCSAGKNTDCDAVLNAKGSSIAKRMNWGDAGIIYFSSYALLLVTFLYTENIVGFSVLASLSVASMPFTLFSLYYQWRIVKKWCTLCLLTVTVLWLQFLTLGMTKGLLLNLSNGIFPSFSTIAFALFVFLIITITWLQIIKPSLQNIAKLVNKNFSLLRFKNNPAIFETLLKLQRQIDSTPFENDLQLGNPNAAIQLVVACNPFCKPCAKTHSKLHELLADNDIGLAIRFSVKSESNDDLSTQTVSCILQLVNNKENFYKREVLHDWYALMHLEKFKEKHPLLLATSIKQQLVQHEEWSKASEIKFTPTIFINGYEMPKEYKVSDFKNVIKHLQFEKEELKNNYALI